jgi:hypothetical protein
MPERLCLSRRAAASATVKARNRAAVAFVLAAVSGTTLAAAPRSGAAEPISRPVPRLEIGCLAVPFEANVGQFEPSVAFAARTSFGTVFVTGDGLIVDALRGPRVGTAPRLAEARHERPSRAPGWTLVERLIGAARLRPVGCDPSLTRVTRLHGSDPAHWQGEVATFGQVSLGEAWPGVTVALAAHGANAEKVFTVAPGADPSQIRLALSGATSLALDGDGSLVATTGNGPVALAPPVAYQVDAGRRRVVAVGYDLAADGTYGFRVGAHDASATLVIDPILQATYLGGTGGDDEIFAIALDASDNVFATGETYSTGFPGTAGGPQPSHSDPSASQADAFVARLSPDLKTLVQATYLGGSSFDAAYAIALDGTGHVLVAGTTASTNFPGTGGGAQPHSLGASGTFHGFVARFSGDLRSLLQASYYGGTVEDHVYWVQTTQAGEVYLGGHTFSSDLPATAQAAQPIYAGSGDSFIARLSGDLGTVSRSTYFGGNGDDYFGALALDGTGAVLITGDTTSTNLPGRASGARPSSAGSNDTFAARFKGDLTTLERSTYFGGTAEDYGTAIAVDAAGSVFLAGYTYSTALPGTSGGARANHASDGGQDDIFVAKLSNDLKTLVQSTYVGGNGQDWIFDYSIALEGLGAVVLAGGTNSTNFPGVSGGVQSLVAGGDADAVAVRLSSDLKQVVQSTYLGGNGFDQAYTMARDSAGNILLAGSTASTDFPGTAGGARPGHSSGSGYEGVAARLTANLRAVTGQLDQGIVFPPLPAQAYWPGATFTVWATASSGLPVAFTSMTPAICTVSGSTVAMLRLGVCSLTANQGGNANYNPAPPAGRDVVIANPVARRLGRPR